MHSLHLYPLPSIFQLLHIQFSVLFIETILTISTFPFNQNFLKKELFNTCSFHLSLNNKIRGKTLLKLKIL